MYLILLEDCWFFFCKNYRKANTSENFRWVQFNWSSPKIDSESIKIVYTGIIKFLIQIERKM